jgi:hypothetical protein
MRALSDRWKSVVWMFVTVACWFSAGEMLNVQTMRKDLEIRALSNNHPLNRSCFKLNPSNEWHGSKTATKNDLCRLLPSFSMPSETLQPVELFMLSRRPFSSPNFT